MAEASETVSSRKQQILLLLGFCFASLGFLNAVPNWGPLPSLGVIRAVDLHPSVFAFGLLISCISVSKFSKSSLLVTMANFGLILAAFFALWSFNGTVREIEDEGLFFFSNFHPSWPPQTRPKSTKNFQNISRICKSLLARDAPKLSKKPR